MRKFDITHQKAAAICRKDLDGVKVPAEKEEYLLSTGAKLGRYNGQYYLYSYHYNSADVAEFLGLVKCAKCGTNSETPLKKGTIYYCSRDCFLCS